MSHIYCSNCAEKIQFSSKKPKVCPFCETRIGETLIKTQKSTSRSEEIKDNEFDIDIDNLKIDFSSANVIIDGTIQQRTTLQSALNKSSEQGNSQFKMGKRKNKSDIIDYGEFSKNMTKDCSPASKSKDIS